MLRAANEMTLWTLPTFETSLAYLLDVFVSSCVVYVARIVGTIDIAMTNSGGLAGECRDRGCRIRVLSLDRDSASKRGTYEGNPGPRGGLSGDFACVRIGVLASGVEGGPAVTWKGGFGVCDRDGEDGTEDRQHSH